VKNGEGFIDLHFICAFGVSAMVNGERWNDGLKDDGSNSVIPIQSPQQIFPPYRQALAVDDFSSVFIFIYAMPVRRHLECHWLRGLSITGYFLLPFSIVLCISWFSSFYAILSSTADPRHLRPFVTDVLLKRTQMVLYIYFM
jgi:hypothetical protein